MSSANVGTQVRVVRLQLDAGINNLVTCIDLTEPTHRKARMLEMSTLQVHRVPLAYAGQAQEIAYDPAHIASFLHRQMRQNDASNLSYDREAVQRVANRLTGVVNEVKRSEVPVRSKRQIAV
jgi:hypothetical protein